MQRGTLTTEQVVHAAVKSVDAEGLDPSTLHRHAAHNEAIARTECRMGVMTGESAPATVAALCAEHNQVIEMEVAAGRVEDPVHQQR